MLYMERVPIPDICKNCQEPECDVCEHASELWYMPQQLELHLRYKGLLKASQHVGLSERQYEQITSEIQLINQKLLPFTERQWDAIEHKTPMTAKCFESCLAICLQYHESEMFSVLKQEFPYLV